MSVVNQINNECAICYDRIEAEEPTLGHRVNEASAHVFHTSCLTRWFQNSESCPTCRAHASVFRYDRSNKLSQAQLRMWGLFVSYFVGFSLYNINLLINKTIEEGITNLIS